MPMKISLALGPREPLSRQTAWGCFTTNAALPGFGSLLAGRKAGYPQAVLQLLGLVLTTVFGIRFIAWYLSHRTQLDQLEAEPDRYFLEIWMSVRWALLGMLVYAVSWLWSLATSLNILREARQVGPEVPPKIGVPPKIT
jgi:hypothetical protein